MTAQIVIDDGTNPPAAGSSDEDNSFLGAVHTLSNFDNTGVLGHRWTLVDKPIGSAASLSSTSDPSVTITPDIAGSYLIRLETYTDAARTILDDADEQVIGIRLPTPFDWLVPAAGETTQQSSSRGWATTREEAIRDVHAFMNSGLPQLTGAVNSELTFADGLVVLGGFLLDAREFPSNALKLRLVGSLTSVAGGDGELYLYDMGEVGTAPGPGVLRATVAILSADAGGVVVRDQTLSVVSSPGVDANEIESARKRYELRASIAAGGAGDALKIHNGGISLEG